MDRCGLEYRYFRGIPAEEEICNAVINTITIEQDGSDDEEENNKAPPSNKEILKTLSVLRRAVQHRAYEQCFEQHYSYKPTQTHG